MTAWLLIAAGLLCLAGVAYWHLVLAEGAYLGPRVVRLLYDWSARYYDRLKGYQKPLEDLTLGIPFAARVGDDPAAWVLDVAVGTGRMPMSLFRQPAFRGRLVGIDISAPMLRRAARNLAAYRDRLALLRYDASRLPFDDGAFDAVSCIEALEFFPEPMGALREMVRVLKPGGALLFTNRIGYQARFLPGRTLPRQGVMERLSGLPLREVEVRSWEIDYDQIWATRAGQVDGEPPDGPLRINLPCSACGRRGLRLAGAAVRCEHCGADVSGGAPVIDLTRLERDVARGER